MRLRNIVLLGLVLCAGLVLAACDESYDESNTPPPGRTQTAIGPGIEAPNALRVRLDSIHTGDSTQDLDGQGELYVDILVIRTGNRSRRLTGPAIGTFPARAETLIRLDDYSLQINNVQPTEEILVHFIVMESDDLNFWGNERADVALDGGLEALEWALENGKIAGRVINHSTVIGFILSALTGEALEWWQEAELIDGYVIRLGPDNGWLANGQYSNTGDLDQVTMTYTITTDQPQEVTRVVEVPREVTRIVEAPTVTADQPDLGAPAPRFEQTRIGTSAAGSAIDAYVLGSGQRSVVVVGGLAAGFAPGTVRVVSDLITHLADNAWLVPSNVTVHLIPLASPDSRAGGEETAAGRVNGNGVDINRNWGCNFSTTAEWRDGQPINPGTAAFSEPESRALRDYFVAVDPEVVIFFSARGEIVAPGKCGNSGDVSLPYSHIYGSAAGYQVRPVTALTVTGDASDWLADRGTPAFFVLLPGYTSTDWQATLRGVSAVLAEAGR